MWPWPDDAHVAFQHIPELRQFVYIGLSHKFTEGKYSRIVLGGLQFVGIAVDVHGTELVAVEIMAVNPRSPLLKKDGSGALHFDSYVDEWEKECSDEKAQYRDDDVEETFYCFVEWVFEGTCVGGEQLLRVEHDGLEGKVLVSWWNIVELNEAAVAHVHGSDNCFTLFARDAEVDFVTKTELVGTVQP